MFTSVLAATLVVLGLATAAETGTPSFEEIAHGYGLSDKDIEKLRRGDRAGGDLNAASDNELVIAVGIPISKGTDWFWERLVEARSSDHTVLAWGPIDSPGEEAFAALTLPPKEIEWLAEVEAGEDANFSTEEIAQIQAVSSASKGPARTAALLTIFRQILAERVAAYQKGGLEAAALYDRGGGKFGSPVGQLNNALEQLKITKQVAPAVFEAMISFPAAPDDGVTSRFYWVVHDADDRVIVGLAHRVFGKQGDRVVAIERRFYVSHTLNSMQAVTVAVPHGDGSVVFYANRTGTDLITGFASGIAKRIGTILMHREIGRLVDSFESAAGDR